MNSIIYCIHKYRAIFRTLHTSASHPHVTSVTQMFMQFAEYKMFCAHASFVH